MRKRYRAELANAEPISPTETSLRDADRARIDAEPVQPRRPQLSVGGRVWFIDNTGRWYELEVVERRLSKGRAVTFKSVTGRDSTGETEWPYGELFEFPVHSPMFKRLRPLSARRP